MILIFLNKSIKICQKFWEKFLAKFIKFNSENGINLTKKIKSLKKQIPRKRGD